MAVLLMIKDAYGVDMSDTDLRKCTTVQDVFDFVSGKS
jgi:acyl carrier protein